MCKGNINTDSDSNTVDVSVAMMTYFHGKYISQAIESVLAQETEYSYEIIISDDGSTDETREILKQYVTKYPNIIKAYFNDKNVGITQNNYSTRLKCQGRYIATLSGDDYWIDKSKLQKQVEFLDSHPDVYATVTCVEGRYENDHTAFEVFPPKKYRDELITLEMYLKGAPVGTHGLMMRNAYLTEEGREYFSLVPKASHFIDDTTECILILMKSPVFSMNLHGVAYRVRVNKINEKNYNSTSNPYTKCRRIIDLYNNLDSHFNGTVDLYYKYKSKVALLLLCLLSTLDYRQFRDIYMSMPERYRKRHILFKAVPVSIRMTVKILLRKFKGKLRSR